MSQESFQIVPKTLWRLFGVLGAEAARDILETLSAVWARRAGDFFLANCGYLT